MGFVIDRPMPEIAVVKVGPELNLQNKDKLEQSCLDEVRAGVRGFVFDFGETDTFDSSGLGMFFAFRGKVVSIGVRIMFANATDRVRTVMNLTRADKVFRLCHTEDVAVRLLNPISD